MHTERLIRREVQKSIFLATRLIFRFFFPGQTLPEGAPERKTECRGTSLIGSCPSNHSLAVKGVQYGTKLTSTCGLSNTSAGCCDYDDADCFITYNGTAQQDACSGRDLCISISVAAADTSSCGNSSYPILNHYLAMEYYCVAGKLFFVREGDLCLDVSVAANGTSSCGNSSYPVLNHYLTLEYYFVAGKSFNFLFGKRSMSGYLSCCRRYQQLWNL